jgi:hypothetical protein
MTPPRRQTTPLHSAINPTVTGRIATGRTAVSPTTPLHTIPPRTQTNNACVFQPRFRRSATHLSALRIDTDKQHTSGPPKPAPLFLQGPAA